MNQAVVLAGGHGKRMKADIPKPMLEVLDVPMLGWVIRACEGAEVSRICVVTGYKAEYIEHYLSGQYETALQSERLGTGHAVMQAEKFLQADTEGNTLVLCGDAPFMDSDTIRDALELHTAQNNAVTVITAELADPKGYGRILRSESDGIAAIVEEKDAAPAQRKIREVNSGAYWFRTADLLELLKGLTPQNAQGEYYLTDTIGLALSSGKRAGVYLTENTDVILGANTRKDLLGLRETARRKILDQHMENGVDFICTEGVVIGTDVEIEAGTVIQPGTLLKGKTKIGKGCRIGPNCVIENTVIGEHCVLNAVQAYDSVIENNVKIGPFVHIRPNSYIRSGVKIGDFVEIKNSVVGEQTSIAHLTYVGDSDVGKKVNFGCGTVTVNYDGVSKQRCEIGDNCFIGCNTNLIAPVKLGKGVYTAAGSTITKDVPDYALAVERGTLKVREGYSLRKLKSKLFSGDKEKDNK
ncbi:MAG: bifunctional UDP-N-acetylglucosamine diphosphorylase/glucosamine-1-phosphate N-acetyltransferase GlmU [Ruminococcus sp.]|nr:bifunctional UDP-N-acetylglucosamine diphosphorylase/glucosamine-1-phosphate N-acetyltransferase GlmU [Ruminococcus sp.]